MLATTIQQNTNDTIISLEGVPSIQYEKLSNTKKPNHNTHASTTDNFKTSFYNPFEVKHRRRTSRAQFRVLEKTFLENPKPNAAVRRWLAETLSMTPRGVQVWFQNRRAKDKANQQKTKDNTHHQQSASIEYKVEQEEIDSSDSVQQEESDDSEALETAEANLPVSQQQYMALPATVKHEANDEGIQFHCNSNQNSPLTTTTTILGKKSEPIMYLSSSPVYSVPCACRECFTATTNANIIHTATATPMSRTLSYPPFFSSDASTTTTVADEEELLMTPVTPTTMDYYYYKQQQQQQQQQQLIRIDTSSTIQSSCIGRIRPVLFDQRRYSYPSQQQAYCYPYNHSTVATDNNNPVHFSTPTSPATSAFDKNNNNLDLFRRFSEPIFTEQQQQQQQIITQPTDFSFDAYFNLIPTHSLSSTRTAATL